MKRYERIADDIRARVARGELVAGARVPSVRDLAARWRVATATAAHALRSLREEGVVVSAPRAGTIVASARSRALHRRARAAHEDEVTRAKLIAAAVAIADDEGLGALSLRGVAAKIGVPVMSLYRHVENKDELLRWMTDAAIGEGRAPVRCRPVGERLEAAARVEWRVFRCHPWLVRTTSSTCPAPLPNALAYAEWIFAALGPTGLDAAEQLRIHLVLHGYVQGLAVNIETEAEAAGATGIDEEAWMARHERAFSELASSGDYPAFESVMARLGSFELDFVEIFERGSLAAPDGFAARIDGAATLIRRRSLRAPRRPKR